MTTALVAAHILQPPHAGAQVVTPLPGGGTLVTTTAPTVTTSNGITTVTMAGGGQITINNSTNVVTGTLTAPGTQLSLGAGASFSSMPTSANVALTSLSSTTQSFVGGAITFASGTTNISTHASLLSVADVALSTSSFSGGNISIHAASNAFVLAPTPASISGSGSIALTNAANIVIPPVNHPTPTPTPVLDIPTQITNVVQQQQQQQQTTPVIPIPILIEFIKAASSVDVDFSNATTNINTVGEFTEQIKANIINPNSPTFQPQLPQLTIVPEAQNIQIFDENNPHAINGDYQPIAYVYPTAAVTDVQLKEGSVLFSPTKLTSVRSKFGRVAINKDAVVLIVNTKEGMAVYDIHDGHDGDVLISAGGNTFPLNPGRNVILAHGDIKALEHINPLGCIAYRNENVDKLPNGTTRIRSEFWIPTALKGLKLYKQIKPETREKVLKNAAALAYMRRSDAKFQFVARKQN